MKIFFLLKHENLTTGKKKYYGKEEKLLLRSNFSSFPQYFQYITNFKSPITYILVKCGCWNYFFLNSANLICRGTDISKYFRESLGIRDNEIRLYIRELIDLYEMSLFIIEKRCQSKITTESSQKHTYIFWPSQTPLLYSKTGVYRGIHYFSYFWSKT